VAAAAGVNVETIRYYQRRGLLQEPAKPPGGYRRYPAEMVNRICFINRAKALGFTLGEVSGLLQLDNKKACATTRKLAAQKVVLIEQKLSQLETMRSALTKLVSQCDKKLKSSTCPIIEILQRGSESQPAANGSGGQLKRKSGKTSSPLVGESPVASLFKRREL
jgi:MerR family mercuric resistance operon transcriptional regulator